MSSFEMSMFVQNYFIQNCKSSSST